MADSIAHYFKGFIYKVLKSGRSRNIEKYFWKDYKSKCISCFGCWEKIPGRCARKRISLEFLNEINWFRLM